MNFHKTSILNHENCHHRVFQVVLMAKNPPANTGEVRDAGSVPESGSSPGKGNGYPLQYSCLKNPMNRGAWWAAGPRITESQTWLRWLSRHTCTVITHRSALKMWVHCSPPCVSAQMLVTMVVTETLWGRKRGGFGF